MKNFIDKRIKKNEQKLNNPIKKNMLLTFENTEKKAASKPKGITVTLRSDPGTFARLLLIQKNRDIDLKGTLQFELTPLPLSLANADGTLSKTVKSKLFAELSKSIPQVTLLLENTVSIFDGMVLFQKLPSTLVTFGDIGDYLCRKFTRTPGVLHSSRQIFTCPSLSNQQSENDFQSYGSLGSRLQIEITRNRNVGINICNIQTIRLN